MESSAEFFPVAPCGINCLYCRAYLRAKNKCPGCWGNDAGKPVTRLVCKIKTCHSLQNGGRKFCFECGQYPCAVLKHLHKRYRTRYNMSVIGNLENIKNAGIGEFLAAEKPKWTCSACGGTICVHKGRCINCGRVK